MPRRETQENETPSPLVESHRVEGTRVHDAQGKQVGTIRYLVIEKASGRVVYVVVTFGGFLKVGSQLHSIPWEKLKYDVRLHGYRTDITEEQLRRAPASIGDEKLWCDQKREREVRDYWDVPPFRGL
jgi:sporulation protein YlmC with PRC-barrel domain